MIHELPDGRDRYRVLVVGRPGACDDDDVVNCVNCHIESCTGPVGGPLRLQMNTGVSTLIARWFDVMTHGFFSKVSSMRSRLAIMLVVMLSMSKFSCRLNLYFMRAMREIKVFASWVSSRWYGSGRSSTLSRIIWDLMLRRS